MTISTEQTERDEAEGGERPKPRKEEILDVATRLFAERGYDGTSMNDVAAMVGMRKASLFYHFATKDVLYEAVVDRALTRFVVPLREAYCAEGSYAERLDKAADALIAALASGPFTARLLVREAMQRGPVVREKLLASILLGLDVAAAFVRAGQDAGAFVSGDAKQIIMSLVGIHFLPFAIGPLVVRFAGTEPFENGFVAARRTELLKQTRRIVLR